MKKLPFLFIITCFLAITSSGQSVSKTTDSILLKIRITDTLGKGLNTSVELEADGTHEKFSFKTTPLGYAACKVPAGRKYTISVPVSTDYYEYDLRGFDMPELDIDLKFHFNNDPKSSDRGNGLVTIKMLNHREPKKLAAFDGRGSELSALQEEDVVFVKSPVGKKLTIACEGIEITGKEILVDNTPYTLQYYILFFTDRTHAKVMRVRDDSAVMYVEYTDFDKKPAANETVTLKDKKNGKQYTVVTSAEGRAIGLVPKNDSFSISLKYYPNFLNVSTGNQNNKLLTNLIYIRYPSSAQMEAYEKEKARLLRVRDSLYKIASKKKEVDAESRKKNLTKEAETIRAEGNVTTDYFIRKQNTVCAALTRNKDKWPVKCIVSDVTGSMYPYMEQVALWHILEFMNKEKSDYLFFNDGDDKPDHLKKIGSTGGLYYVPENKPDSVLRSMATAMENGSGGDGPENNIEALLEAEKHLSPSTELVMIADNFASVKDIELLKKLTHPVHIILCGTQYGLHIDYLEIAYRTGGSIHTMEEDLFNLATLHDEETITIGGKSYKFMKGKFFPTSMRL